MTFRETMQQLGSNTESVIMQLWERHLAGDIDQETLEQLTGELVAVSNVRGWTLGALAFTGYAAAVTARPVVVPSVPPGAHYADPARLTEAARTILTDDSAPRVAVRTSIHYYDEDITELVRERKRKRLARLANSEPIEAAQTGYSEAIRSDGLTEGWTRGMSAEPCQLCNWWDRDGRVWPKDHAMPTHKGCTCHPVPVFVDYEPMTAELRDRRLAERARANTLRFNPDGPTRPTTYRRTVEGTP